MDQKSQSLDHLFERYRMAVPDPEASVNFMPELWRKIEARQFFLARVKKLTQVFVAAAAAICLLLGIALQVPVSQRSASRERQLCRRAGGRQSYRESLRGGHPGRLH